VQMTSESWYSTNKYNTQESKNILKVKNKNQKLEIWGKAQRESARRPKSDWGKLEGG